MHKCGQSNSCFSEKVMVQDKVCTNWQFTTAGSQAIYTDNISSTITGTGYVKVDSAVGTVSVDFFRTGDTTAFHTLLIPAKGSASFTIFRFNVISITTTSAAHGEFCITVRYSL